VPIDASGVIGQRQSGIFTRQIPFSAAVRYYAASGDQLGVGPLPPVAGQATTFWAVWTVGPFEENLKSVMLSTVLPDGVTATGKFASSIAGTFKADGRQVTWDIPSLQLLGNSPASFAFEIQATPHSQDVGHAMKLLDASSITAVTEKENAQVQASASGDDSNIQSDQKGRGRGMVQGS